MNDDRISELYKGEIWSDEVQARARRRIHWLCSQARGTDVLDVGCSQGIASILLGREGFTVRGVDVQPSRIEYARNDLAQEPEIVRERVSFELANGASLPFGDDSFDTVLLGEVIEHLVAPGRVLAEARRVARPGGVVVITTPFGLSPHHDHKQTFYVHHLIDVLEAGGRVQSLEIADRYFRVVLGDPESAAQGPDLGPTVDEAMEYLDHSLRVANHELSARTRERDDARERAKSAQDSLAALAEEKERAETLNGTRIVALETELAGAEEDLVRKQEVANHATTQAAEAAKREADARRKVGGLEVDRKRLRSRIGRLERDRTTLRYRLSLAEWRLSSFRKRKWTRMGAAIGAVKRNPFRIFILPFDLVSIAFSSSSLPPRPTPPKDATSTKAATSADADTAPARTSSVGPNTAETGLSLAAPLATRLSDLRVAAILDEMSASSFGPEATVLSFTPSNWREVLERERPNLLLVESAWRGNEGSWEYRVGTYAYPQSIGLPDLTDVTGWCRDHGVPTVFWNKEDPVHFEKFKEAAQLFDVVMTTDEDMIERYRSLPGLVDARIEVLPFAAQPTLHRPACVAEERDRRPVFAGAYYRNRHPKRRAELDLLLDAALPYDLVIYDRMNGQVSDSFGFPDRFTTTVSGGLAYEDMVAAYRKHRVFLNVNSVSESPSMFSRRVFELLASGTPVISTPSVGMQTLFGDIVSIVSTPEEAADALKMLIEDDDIWLDRSLRGVEAVYGRHLYRDRLETIARAAGFDLEPTTPRIAAALDPNAGVAPEAVLAETFVEAVFVSEAEGPIPSTPGVVGVGHGRDVVDAAAYAPGGFEWVARISSQADLEGLGTLATGPRLAAAEMYVPWDGSSRPFSYVTSPPPEGLVLVRREAIVENGSYEEATRNRELAGFRTYAVPVVPT